MNNRFNRSLPPASMLVAILALVLAGAGVGYTAGTIGTNDLKNDAVTSPKVKNGSLKNADLSKEEKLQMLGHNGVDFSDGGQGDCDWLGYDEALPFIQGPGYRMDRSGIVHLNGLVAATNGAGGDADCGDDTEDGIMFILPKKYVPARTQFIVQEGGSSVVYVIGKGGVDEIPAGAVYVESDVAFLEGISFPAAGSPVSPAPLPPMPKQSLRQLTELGRQVTGR